MTLTALITGASKGIGQALALKLASEGLNVIGVGRNKDELDRLACSHTNIRVIQCDLAAAEERSKLLDAIDTHIDILVNNAGVESHIGNISTITDEVAQGILQVNLIAPMVLTAGLMCKGLLTHSSRILNLSSRAADQAFRGVSVYCASKSGIDSFSRSLVEEGYLAASVVPGEVDTDIQSHLRAGDFPLKQFFLDAKSEGRLLAPKTTAVFLHYLLLKLSETEFSGKKHNIYDKSHWASCFEPSILLPLPAGERESNMRTRVLDIN